MYVGIFLYNKNNVNILNDEKHCVITCNNMVFFYIF